MHQPGYLKLLGRGELEKRVKILNEMLENCVLCPHQCQVNRLKGERGFCRTLEEKKLSFVYPSQDIQSKTRKNLSTDSFLPQLCYDFLLKI